MGRTRRRNRKGAKSDPANSARQEKGARDPKRETIFKIVVPLVVLMLAGLVAVYVAEAFLRASDPGSKLPPNGQTPDGLYTWGHKVINNRHGFREREFATPKPPGLFRVVVLGDSLTWGAGLAPEERYSAVLEILLTKAYPERKFEVLNFGVSGGPTVLEHDILLQIAKPVAPDLVIVGFCLNDPQRRGQDYSPEKESFQAKNRERINGWEKRLASVGLKKIGARVKKAMYNSAQKRGEYPSWQEALQRAYDPVSENWQAFIGALNDINTTARETTRASPMFIILNQGTYRDKPTDYAEPDEELKTFLAWYDQAEQAAEEAGFETMNIAHELAATYRDKSMAVNILDGHPNADLNRMYAEKLFAALSERLNSSAP